MNDFRDELLGRLSQRIEHFEVNRSNRFSLPPVAAEFKSGPVVRR